MTTAQRMESNGRIQLSRTSPLASQSNLTFTTPMCVYDNNQTRQVARQRWRRFSRQPGWFVPCSFTSFLVVVVDLAICGGGRFPRQDRSAHWRLLSLWGASVPRSTLLLVTSRLVLGHAIVYLWWAILVRRRLVTVLLLLVAIHLLSMWLVSTLHSRLLNIRCRLLLLVAMVVLSLILWKTHRLGSSETNCCCPK